MFLDDALAWSEGVSRLGRILDIKPPSIYAWGDIVPRGRAYEIYYKSDGVVPLHEEHYNKLDEKELDNADHHVL